MTNSTTAMAFHQGRMKSTLTGASLVLLLAITGCASGPNPRDPFEPFNRKVSSFNDTMDSAIVKPVAQGYQSVTPSWLQQGVRNFFNNLSDVWSTVNNGLQGKGHDSAESLMRVVVNTTAGIGGVFDVASKINLQRHPEDFGQTLGVWGVGSGPYLVLPVFGPSTVRDSAGLGLDLYVDPLSKVNNIPARNDAIVLRFVDKRASLLGASNLLEEASLDKYSFTRDAYFQLRRSQIYDGNPPDEDDDSSSQDQ
jgi:phospholipid-binding lipoprotein MlaA